MSADRYGTTGNLLVFPPPWNTSQFLKQLNTTKGGFFQSFRFVCVPYETRHARKTSRKEGLLGPLHLFFIRHICFQTLLLVPNTTHPMLIGSFPPLWIPNDRKSDRKTSINRPIKRCYGARKITTHHARSAREGRGKLKWMNEWMRSVVYLFALPRA